MDTLKIIVSSKDLANTLREVDFNQNYVSQIIHNSEDQLIFQTSHGIDLFLHCHAPFNGKKRIINQDHIRWDWAYDTCNAVVGHPVVIEIDEICTSIKFQY